MLPKNNNILSLLLCFFILFCFTSSAAQSKIYAINIGISDYFEVPDLSFAHKDAIAFNNLLEKQYGKGRLNSVLLTDSIARYEKIIESIHFVSLHAEPRDTFIFFFSGHGKLDPVRRNKSHFLPYLASSQVYNPYALNSDILKDYFDEIRGKGAEVILFIDACRAGAFGDKRSSLVRSELGQPFANEIKFFSCAIDQLSIEKSSLGDGHGVFTYYLIEGLNGASDKNQDCKINVHEISTYLFDEISAETNDQQTPICICTKPITKISSISDCEPQLAQFVKAKKFKRPVVNDKKQKIIQAFDNALREKRLLEPKNFSAQGYYEVFSKKWPKDTVQISMMKIRLVNELTRKANYGLLDYINYERLLLSKTSCDTILRNLTAAIDLLGDQDILVNSLRAQYFFFKALNHYFIVNGKIDSTISLLKSSLTYEDSVAYIYNALGNGYSLLGDYQQAKDYFNQANMCAPNWKIPKGNLKKVNGMLERFQSIKSEHKEKEREIVKNRALNQRNNSPNCGGGMYMYVKMGGSGCGKSWSDATDLQTALKSATPGSEIWVAKGTYIPTNSSDRSISFKIPSGVKVLGGFAGNEVSASQRDWESNLTILDGDIGNKAFDQDNSYTVVVFERVNNRTVLDGFTIINGFSDGTVLTEGDIQRSGGAIYNNGSGGLSNPIIKNCILTDNFSRDGAAIYNYARNGDATAYIENCEFDKNKADLQGGAICNYAASRGVCYCVIRGCSFLNNRASYGGAIYNIAAENSQVKPLIDRCSFAGNVAYISASAVGNYSFGNGECKPFLSENDFSKQNRINFGRDVQEVPIYSSEKSSEKSDIKLGSGE